MVSIRFYRDYKVHKPIIKILFDKKYDSLWGIEVEQYNNTENQNKLAELVRRVKDEYIKIRKDVRKCEFKNLEYLKYFFLQIL